MITETGHTRYSTIPSPLGDLLVTGDADGLTGLYLPTGKHVHTPDRRWTRDDTAFDNIRAQIGEYFAGTRTRFDLPLHPVGSAFQQTVWRALCSIPYGCTSTYGRLAAGIGSPTAARAVGLANGQNPISIIVPCHRVIGANGSLVGYGGGLPAKQWLLQHEAAHAGLFAS